MTIPPERHARPSRFTASGAVRPRIRSEALSAIIMVEALRLAEIIRGMMEASITRRPCKPVHAQLVVDHRPCAVGRAHAAGAAGVEGRGAALGCRGEKFIVGLHVRAGKILVGVIGRERRGCEQPPRQLHAGDDDAAIELLDQIVGLDDRRLERIGRAGADIAAAFRPLLPGRDRHAGLVLELALHALLVARGREGQLQVGALGGLAGMPEAIDHGRRQREQAAPRRRPFHRLDPQTESRAGAR